MRLCADAVDGADEDDDDDGEMLCVDVVVGDVVTMVLGRIVGVCDAVDYRMWWEKRAVDVKKNNVVRCHWFDSAIIGDVNVV